MIWYGVGFAADGISLRVKLGQAPPTGDEGEILVEMDPRAASAFAAMLGRYARKGKARHYNRYHRRPGSPANKAALTKPRKAARRG